MLAISQEQPPRPLTQGDRFRKIWLVGFSVRPTWMPIWLQADRIPSTAAAKGSEPLANSSVRASFSFLAMLAPHSLGPVPGRWQVSSPVL